MKKCLVLGAIMLDIILEIDRLPQTGEDIYAKSQSMTLGGCAYNVASILKHFKIPYTLFSPIGNGIYANYIQNELKKIGHKSIIKSEIEDNGYTISIVECNGERTFITIPGIECSFKKDWFDILDINEYDSIYISGYEIESNGGNIILDFLEAHQNLTIYYAPGPRITYIPKSKQNRLFNLSPVLHLNEMEALSITRKQTIEDAAVYLYQKTNNTVIITLGKNGAYIYDKYNYKEIIPSNKVKAVNTIGAGDAHIATIIAMRTLGKDFKTTVNYANKISAIIVQTKGSTLSDKEFKKGVCKLNEEII